MSLSKKSIGLFITQIAIAILLIVMGIATVQLNSSGSGIAGLDNFVGSARASVSGNEIASAVYSLLGRSSTLAKPIILILGICEILGGVFLCVDLFVSTGKLQNLFILIIVIMWCVVIVLVDFLGNAGITNVNWQSASAILSYLRGLASHLLILGAMFTVMGK